MTDIAGSVATTATLEGDLIQMAAISGEFETVGDRDWIRVDLLGVSAYQIFASAATWGAGAGDTDLRIYDSSGNLLFFNGNDGPSANSRVFVPSASGTYYIEVSEATQALGDWSLVLVRSSLPASRNGVGDDSFNVFPGTIHSGDKGDDTLTAAGGAANPGVTLLGEQGDDTLTGDAFDNQLAGGLGNDTIQAGLGRDLLLGEAGNDFMFGEAGEDRLYGGSGYDFLQGGNDNDQLFGGADNDSLAGDFGNDLLDGGAGADRMVGGQGDDQLIVDDPADTAIEFANEGFDTVLTTVSFALGAGQSIEVLRVSVAASTSSINLWGNELANQITGNNGANVLDGRAGSDVLQGLAGNDTYMLGSEATGVDSVIDTGGIDRIMSNIARSLLGYGTIENLTLLGSLAVGGTGNGLSNTLVGNGAGNLLDGGLGNDRLLGLGGNDVLIGGAGRDSMTGGLGDDLFRFASGAQSPSGSGADSITDFDDYGNDRIDLRGVYGGTLQYVHNAAFSGIGQVRINDVSDSSVIVEVNTGGSLAADMQIRLTGTTLAAMTSSDFVL